MSKAGGLLPPATRRGARWGACAGDRGGPRASPPLRRRAKAAWRRCGCSARPRAARPAGRAGAGRGAVLVQAVGAVWAAVAGEGDRLTEEQVLRVLLDSGALEDPDLVAGAAALAAMLETALAGVLAEAAAGAPLPAPALVLLDAAAELWLRVLLAAPALDAGLVRLMPRLPLAAALPGAPADVLARAAEAYVLHAGGDAPPALAAWLAELLAVVAARAAAWSTKELRSALALLETWFATHRPAARAAPRARAEVRLGVRLQRGGGGRRGVAGGGHAAGRGGARACCVAVQGRRCRRRGRPGWRRGSAARATWRGSTRSWRASPGPRVPPRSRFGRDAWESLVSAERRRASCAALIRLVGAGCPEAVAQLPAIVCMVSEVAAEGAAAAHEAAARGPRWQRALGGAAAAARALERLFGGRRPRGDAASGAGELPGAGVAARRWTPPWRRRTAPYWRSCELSAPGFGALVAPGD